MPTYGAEKALNITKRSMTTSSDRKRVKYQNNHGHRQVRHSVARQLSVLTGPTPEAEHVFSGESFDYRQDVHKGWDGPWRGGMKDWGAIEKWIGGDDNRMGLLPKSEIGRVVRHDLLNSRYRGWYSSQEYRDSLTRRREHNAKAIQVKQELVRRLLLRTLECGSIAKLNRVANTDEVWAAYFPPQWYKYTVDRQGDPGYSYRTCLGAHDVERWVEDNWNIYPFEWFHKIGIITAEQKERMVESWEHYC